MKKYLTYLNLLLVSSAFSAGISYAQGDSSCRTLDLLKIETPLRSNVDHLASIFALNPSCFNELLMLVDNQNDRVSANAEEAIRYIGEKQTLQKLKAKVKERDIPLGIPSTGPLSDSELKYLSDLFDNPKTETPVVLSDFLLALVLDRSEKAKLLLERIRSSRGNRVGTFLFSKHSGLADLQLPFTSKADFWVTLKPFAGFLESSELERSKARILAFNYSRDQVLLEIKILGGSQVMEVYHVVLRKSGESWQYASISNVVIS